MTNGTTTTAAATDPSASTLDDITQRVRFFDNQLLVAADMVAEQRYHMDRQRRLIKFLYTPGIVTGLGVSQNGGDFTVSQGTAIDAEGRQIMLISDSPVRNPNGLKTGAVVIAFNESYTSQNTNQSTRWLEDPLIELIPNENTSGKIILAQIEKGQPKPNSGTYAGLRLRGPLSVGEAVGSLLLQPGSANLDGTLAVSGVTTLSGGLSVTKGAILDNVTVMGAAALNGGLTMSGAAALNGILTVSSGLTTLQRGLSVSGGQTQLKSDLIVTGATILSGDSTSRIPSLTVNGLTNLNGPLTITSSAKIQEGLLVVEGGAIVQSGGFEVMAGPTRFADTLTVTGAAALNGGLTVSDITQLNGNINIGTAKANVTTTVWGNINLNGPSTLIIGGDSALNETDRPNLIKFGNRDSQILYHAAKSNKKPALGRNTLGIHIPTDDAFGLYSSGWTSLLEIAGGTGDMYVKGKVGIGITKPVEMLHVLGNVHIQGNLNIEGEKPFMIRHYTGIPEQAMYPTGYFSQDWTAAIIGFKCVTRNEESGNFTGMRIQMALKSDNQWYIIADIWNRYDAPWDVDVMFIRSNWVR